MTNDEIILTEGAHLHVRPEMKSVKIEIAGETGSVRLFLATESLPLSSTGYGRPQGATTMAVDIDRNTAMCLLIGLHDLAGEMDWPLQEAVSGRAEFQSGVLPGPRPWPKK